MIGETIGNFRILKRIGEGGMGEVFVAEQQSIGTLVAVKTLLPHISQHKDHVQRFFNEARAVSRIRHAGIVKIYDVGYHTNGQAYLIMELLEGEPLSKLIERPGRLTDEKIRDIGRQASSVLAATHAAGITHRDLKPDNIFIVPDHELASGERVKILDFGIAKLTGTMAADAPRTVGTMGTPAYMAPEQWADSSNVDPRADVYSLGCVLFEMACGRPPFLIASIADACAKHLHELPPAAHTLAPAIRPDLDALFARMLAKSASARPTLSEVSSILGSSTGAPGSASSRAFDSTVFASSHRRTGGDDSLAHTTMGGAAGQLATRGPNISGRRALGVGLVALGVAAAAGGGYLAFGRTSNPAATASQNGASTSTLDAAFVDERPVDASIDAMSHRDRIEHSNPFVIAGGVNVQEHQVTRAEYRSYLETLSSEDRKAAAPRAGWDAQSADIEAPKPVEWVTRERAEAFCSSIGARLPTNDEWTQVSAGDWGLDPTDSGQLGPLREWTSSSTDGLAVVRGGHAAMKAAARANAAAEPLLKSTESQAGDSPDPETIAGATIGFRCVR